MRGLLMINSLKDLSIQKKLTSILLFSSCSGLMIVSVLLLVLEVSKFKQDSLDELTRIAELIGNRSTAALSFDDVTLAQENLSSLAEFPIVQSACIYDQQGDIFSSFKTVKYQGILCPEKYIEQRSFFDGVSLYVYNSIVLDAERLGTVFIRATLEDAFFKKIQFISLLIIVLVIATAITFFMTAPFLRMITTPLQRLLKTVNGITEQKDYSKRAVKYYKDEVGALVDAFNEMVEKVEHQNNALTLAKNHYLALYDDNPTMVFHLTAEGDIISVNRFGAKQLDLTSEQLHDRSIFDFVHPDDKLAAKNVA